MTAWVSDLMRNVNQYGEIRDDGLLTLTNAPPDVLTKIRDEADAVLSFGLQAVDGIGDGLCLLRRGAEPEGGEEGMGLALQLLSDLMQYANEVRNIAQSSETRAMELRLAK